MTAVAALMTIVLLSACSDRSTALDAPDERQATTYASLRPEQRAVMIRVTGCGAANDAVGNGVLVGDDRILTAAHVVASSSSVSVEFDDPRLADSPVDIIALDRRADLALLRFTGGAPEFLRSIPTVDVGRAEPNEAVQLIVVGGGRSATVIERSLLRTNEVRGTAPAERVAYRLDANTEPGESGAGVYLPSADGPASLVAVVFADSVGNTAGSADTSWAVAGSEIETFLTKSAGRSEPYWCDAGASKLVAGDGD